MIFKKVLISILGFFILLPGLFLTFEANAQTVTAKSDSIIGSETMIAQENWRNWRNYVPLDVQGIAGGNLTTVIQRVINILLLLAAIVAIIYIIVGGYQYTTAAGNAEAAAAARSTILNALIGLIIIFSAYAIVNWIVYRFLHF